MKNPWDESIFCWWTPNVIRMFAGSYQISQSESASLYEMLVYQMMFWGIYQSCQITISILATSPFSEKIHYNNSWLNHHVLLAKSLSLLVKTVFLLAQI